MTLDEQLQEQKRRVDFNSYDISVKELISMFESGIIDIAPEYQRQFRWEEDRQSSLIESIFLGIPIPNLFMATNADGTWELIDGVQRLSTIIHFAGSEEVLGKINLKENLILDNLEKITELNRKKFSELSKNHQYSFLLNSPLKVITLSDKSDVDVRFDLFERLNTGGVKLSDQEIRSCIFRGNFNNFIKELAKNEYFAKVVKLTKKQENDGTKEELVLRFFAYLNDYQNFDHSVIKFLNNYMKQASENFNYEEGTKIFEYVFKSLFEKLENGIVRGTRNLTPLNLYEAISVGAALAYLNTGKLNLSDINGWMNSEQMQSITSGATNSKSRVRERIHFAKENFEKEC
ncbi:hypothetical protein ACZ11_23790 [Lysinibacillus xylanilyticus]|uniref:GmrSD restriction endonucleases N-terminal domain-containing protein n=1 Tax=Lysinibacillus xylanilyticus TaxID=582475 RepID=A0A0K9F144_9BACI|nr:DUF262 domain-containing protein [Lysinibacillus xylanilyticus]KMY28260.1 hypothetical protein ACZ11_23790 [Lysinibacillus xylanilyticus]